MNVGRPYNEFDYRFRRTQSSGHLTPSRAPFSFFGAAADLLGELFSGIAARLRAPFEG